jgi:hypothetical protein
LLNNISQAARNGRNISEIFSTHLARQMIFLKQTTKISKRIFPLPISPAPFDTQRIGSSTHTEQHVKPQL